MSPPRRRDPDTLDLFAWEPPVVAPCIEAERVRTGSLRIKVAKSLAAALKDDGRAREVIAAELTTYLGEEISTQKLNDWASESKDERNMPAHVLIALISVLGSERTINALLQGSGFMAVSDRYEPLIKRELGKEAVERLEREIKNADVAWRSHR